MRSSQPLAVLMSSFSMTSTLNSAAKLAIASERLSLLSLVFERNDLWSVQILDWAPFAA
jgi:hypothetical protein